MYPSSSVQQGGIVDDGDDNDDRSDARVKACLFDIPIGADSPEDAWAGRRLEGGGRDEDYGTSSPADCFFCSKIDQTSMQQAIFLRFPRPT